MAIEVTDEMLKQLAQAWVETLPIQYPETDPPHRFSLRFHIKMMPVLWEAKRREEPPHSLHVGRALTALLAAALISATVAMAVPSIREKVFRLVREVYEKYSAFHYEQVEPIDEEAEFEEFVPYYLTYIPEGYVLVEDRTTDFSHREQFENAEGSMIILTQSRIDRTEFSLDTENQEPKEIILSNGCIAWYLGNETYKVIYWSNDEYSFQIFAHLSLDELMKTANSTTKKLC